MQWKNTRSGTSGLNISTDSYRC